MIWLVYHDKDIKWENGYVIQKIHTDYDEEEQEYFTLMLTSPMCLRCFRIFLQSEYPNLIKKELITYDWAWNAIIVPFTPERLLDTMQETVTKNIENNDN